MILDMELAEARSALAGYLQRKSQREGKPWVLVGSVYRCTDKRSHWPGGGDPRALIRVQGTTGFYDAQGTKVSRRVWYVRHVGWRVS